MASQETINIARQLAEALCKAQNDYDTLNFAPICGKPGKGFKAKRKLRSVIEAARANVRAVELETFAFLHIDSKAGNARRAARREVWETVCAEWGM